MGFVPMGFVRLVSGPSPHRLFLLVSWPQEWKADLKIMLIQDQP